MNTININVQASLSARSLDRNQEMLNRSLNRLSSGSKIVDPADDAAGTASSSKMSAQNDRLAAANTNVQDGLSYVQTTDGYLSTIGNTIDRMSELATLASDPTKSASDVALYQTEFTSLQDELRSTIGGTTAQIGGTADVTAPSGSFNGRDLFGSSTGGGQTISIGDSAGQQLTIPDTNLRTGAVAALISQDSSGNYTLKVGSSAAVSDLTNGTQAVAAQRATLGASESRLNLIASNLTVQQQNLTAAVSSIQDVDVASESTQYAKYNVLVQANTAMLAQANLSPQSLLKLLEN